MPPTKHSSEKLPQSTTMAALGDSEVQHVATSATKDDLSQSAGNQDEVADLAPRNSRHGWRIGRHHFSTFPAMIPASSGTVQEALD